MSNNLELIVSGIIGLITGTIASFIAPWVRWGIEKRKIRHQKRSELIFQIREFVKGENYTREKFLDTSMYSQIRPFLDKLLVKEIEKSSNEITINIGGGRRPRIEDYNLKILDDFTRLERKWRLI